MLLNYGAGEDSQESLGQQGDQTSQSSRKSTLNIHWKDWCWSGSFNTLAIWCKELTHWKRPWCWERLKAGGEQDDRGWDGWMASLTQWTWVWANSGRQWRTGKLTLCNPMDCSTPGFPVHHQLLEHAQTHVQVCDAIQPSHSLSSLSPSAFSHPQHQNLSQWVSSSQQVAKVLEFQLQHQSSFQWIFRLISFRIDWFDLLAVQRTLKSLQHHSSKASILQHLALFMIQLSHPYMTTGKTITLTISLSAKWYLLFNILSRFVIAFLPRSKRLLISWLQSPSAVI